MEKVNTQESWNKKRIFVALFLILLLVIGGYFFKTRILGTSSNQDQVMGVTTQDKSSSQSLDIQQAVKEKINSIKQQVSGLNLVEIASSSPQVQKIINDIKSLQDLPNNQVKEICKKICGL